MLTTKITYELAEWIRECIELIHESPSIESCYKLTLKKYSKIDDFLLYYYHIEKKTMFLRN